MSEHYSIFIDEFGEGEIAEVPGEPFVLRYRDRLPSSFLAFVCKTGFASYAKGLFHTVDPERLSFFVQRWCDQFEALSGKSYLVFARSAFGSMYAVQEGTGRIISVSFLTGTVWAPKKILTPSNNIESGIQSFFASAFPSDFDVEDASGASLFEKGTSIYGSIKSDEMFGFEPMLALGGTMSVDSLRKLRLDVHLDLLAQMSKPVLRFV